MSVTILDGLRASGVAITSQRRAICDWLEGNETHPAASDVYVALHGTLPGLSLATVYNTLTLLSELDLIHEVSRSADGSVRYDPNSHPHLNLVCTMCGRITDHELPGAALESLRAIAQAQGFQIHDSNLVMHGRCADCHDKGQAS